MKELDIKRMPPLPFEMAEALNHLRINLSFCGDQVKTIMVTSSVPGEGKSFVAMHLWKMMAEVGIPVLLVDCDFRNSRLWHRYGISAASGEDLVGAAHYLAGRAELRDVVYQTNVSNGYMIPAASTIANPAILLENPRFARMMGCCKQQFGYVLVDTPPLGRVSDALNIARRCDGSILVIRSGETPRKVVRHSVQRLSRADSLLLGVVLNRMELKGRYGRRYAYSHYGYKKDAGGSDGRSHSHLKKRGTAGPGKTGG